MSSLSEEEDTGPSLKELVTKNLESNGILGKLQAQLRASVFLILEEEFKEKNIPLINEKSQCLLSSPLGEIATALIQDFLQCLSLEFTLAVFCPESKTELLERSSNRQNLNRKFGSNISQIKGDDYPLLFQLIENTQQKQEEKSSGLKNGFAESQPETKNSSSPSNTTNINRPESTVHNDLTEIQNQHPTLPIVDSVTETKDLRDVGENGETHGEERLLAVVSTKEEKTIDKTVANGDTPYHDTSPLSAPSMKNEDTEPSSQSSTSISEKDTLSGLEKEYEDEFSSLSEGRKNNREGENTPRGGTPDENEERKEERKDSKQTTETSEEEEKTEIDEEDIEEEFSIEDLLSTTSEVSNETKDITASKDNSVADYEETL